MRTNFRATLLTFVMAFSLTGSALAFDEDGFRTGMTRDEVKKNLPKNLRLQDKPYPLEDGTEHYATAFKHRESIDPRYLGFYFCDGLLTGFIQSHIRGEDFVRYMQTFLARYGQPTKIEAGDFFPSTDGRAVPKELQVRWRGQPDRILLTFIPGHRYTKERRTTRDWVMLTFYTPTASCPGSEMSQPFPRRPPVPFGDLSLNN